MTRMSCAAGLHKLLLKSTLSSKPASDMDISKLGNCGVYDQPSWIKNIKLVQTQKQEPALIFPKGKSADQLLQAMRTVPVWESSQPVEEEELAIEEAIDSSGPVQEC